MDVTHVLVVQAFWDGSIPNAIIAIYASHDVIDAFERIDELRAEQDEGSSEYEGASFSVSLFRLEVT